MIDMTTLNDADLLELANYDPNGFVRDAARDELERRWDNA
jgi:hypothetical protein